MRSHADTNPSYWMATTPQGWPEPADTVGGHFEVVVVGAGITGLVTTALLREEGLVVAIVEAGPIAAGTTGFTTAKVTALHGLKYAQLRQRYGVEGAAIYAEANLWAIDEIERLVEHLAIDCDFERLPAYTYTEDRNRVADVEAEAEAAAAAGFTLTVEGADIALPYPVAAAVRADNQAQFHPRRFCLSLANALIGGGATVWAHTRALDVRRGSPCQVDTQRGSITADRVVVATHLPFLDKGLFFAKTHPVRSYATAVTLKSSAPSGMYLGVDDPVRSVGPIRTGGVEAIIGGESHKVGHEPDTHRRYRDLESWARSRLPLVSVDYRWSAQDHVPADGVPYVGREVARDNRVLVATGFAKWGMTMAAVTGRIITDLVTGRDNAWAGLFDATRLRPARAARSLVRENLDVVRRFVGGRIRSRHALPAEGLQPGQGGICDLNGETAAAFRNADGQLHAVRPRCTHLGCLVSWNPAEQTWDCPCHGSRFSTEGEVIEGPAVAPLEPIAIPSRQVNN